MTHLVDIIVPVFKGFEQSKRCLSSLTRSRHATAHEVIVVNDASPDPRIAALLRELSRKQRITLIEHSNHRGHAHSIHEAAALHPRRDIVLVNSDTEVAGDWLDRLSRCACKDARIATVSPFSNNTDLCSYPRFCGTNRQPANLFVAELDAVFRWQGAGVVLEIPTGDAFCLYIRRTYLDATGGLHADLSEPGSGENLDFWFRASGMGYKHVLCADTYVFHQGLASHGESRPQEGAQAPRLIDKRYPEYSRLVREHVDKDPSRHVRRAVDLVRLRTSRRPRVLMISHGQGDVRRHVENLGELLAGVIEVLVLEPCSDSVHTLVWLHPEEEFAVYLDLHSDYKRLVHYLKQIGISRLHYHHVQGFPPSILQLAQDLETPYWCTVHDFFPICPQYDLCNQAGDYCGEPEIEGCSLCLEARPPQWGWGIGQWRKEFATFLREADLVIVPTRDAANRLERHFSGLRPKILDHLRPCNSDQDGLEHLLPTFRKIAVLGRITAQKGLRTITDCARQASERGIPLCFRIIGALDSLDLVARRSIISITGEYQDTELTWLIAQERPDAFFFASEAPEIYSYTLSAAMQTGLPIIAVDGGPFAERLADYSSAYILSPETTPAEWNRLFLSIPSAFPLTASYRRRPETTDMEAGYKAYRTMYATDLTTKCPTEDADPIPAAYLYIPDGKEPSLPDTKSLVANAIDCGHGESLDQLHTALNDAAERLSSQALTLAEKDRVIAERSRTISARDELILQQKRELIGKTKQSDVLGFEIQRLEQALQRREATHNELKKANKRQVATLKRNATDLRRRTTEIEESTIWRITFPVRMLAHRLKAIGRQIRTVRETLPQRTRKAVEVLQQQGPRGLVAATRRAGHPHARVDQARPRHTRESRPSIVREIRPLRMPQATSPLVSIVIPTYGHHKTTYACLDAVVNNTPGIAIEVIVVDDGYFEPAAPALSPVEGLRVIRNDSNLGFLKSCNRGAELARGHYILFLNNDTLVGSHWLRHLLSTFDSFDHVGAVGAKLLFPNGDLQEAGGIVWRDGSAWNYGRGKDPSDPRFNYVREVDYCSATCLLLPRNLFLELGGFDEGFAPAYYEDTDLCFSLRAHGLRVLYQPKAEVTHFEGISHETDEGSGGKAHQVRHRELFAKKWHTVLAGHRENGVEPEYERDRRATHRILWVEACMLTPDQDSGSLRALRLLILLRDMGIKVTFIADLLDYRQPYVEELQQSGVEVQYRPYTTSVKDYLRKNAQRQDVIVLCRHYVAVKYFDLIRSLARDTRIVFDTVDLHYLRLRRQACIDHRTQTKRLAKAAHRDETRLVRECDLTLVVSDLEREILAQEAPEADVVVLSNVHDPIDPIAPVTHRKGILFVGSFQHPPNIDAIRHFAADIWPQVRDALPDVKTYVIGSKMSQELERTGREAGLDMLGYVRNIEPYFHQCRLSISPLRYGAGVKGKVNQSMSYGLPVVATTTSIEGMALTAEKDILVADLPRHFADAIVRLYTDDELWERMSKAGLRNIEQRFSTEVARNALEEVLERLGLPRQLCP